jgi:hypothetical protein
MEMGTCEQSMGITFVLSALVLLMIVDIYSS